MKTYVITLERSKERNLYIKKHVVKRSLDYQIIPAVDGSLLTEEDIKNTCNLEIVNQNKRWLTNGAIGCALSHLNAYLEFIKTPNRSAFIIEDDVLLPKNINLLLNEIEREIKPSEIILLYYSSFKPAKFSAIGETNLSFGGLYYPIDIKQPISTTAYIIGREAAINLIKIIKPIRTAADSWFYFYSKGAFNSFRLHYPSLTLTKNFKSSINYFKKGSIKHYLSLFINNYKIPILYHILKYNRKKILTKC